MKNIKNSGPIKKLRAKGKRKKNANKDTNGQANGSQSTQPPPQDEDGFISFDIPDEQLLDDNASIMTSRFQQFEDELENVSSDDEEYIKASGKRKRSESEESTNKKMKMSECPWLRDHSATRNMQEWLTKEIKDFVAYVSPAEAEIVARNDAMRRIRELVHELWYDAECHVFGSYATNLYLPGSDIDMVILSDSGRYDTRSYLYQLSSKLRSKGVAKRVEPIAKARVPIIKMVEAKTNIHIDISFEKRNGISTVNTINRWKDMFPELRCFILVVKQFLARRRLNEVHTGGLGGFSIICLVVSFLKNHPRVASGELKVEDNLGVLLIEFFELYGKKFNYDRVGLCMTGKMGYLPKATNPHLQNKSTFALAIEDPNDDTNNISRGSFNIAAIKKAFSGAFDMLTSRCFALEDMSYKQRRGKSILGHVVQLRGPERDFEDSTSLVRNEYADVKVIRKKESVPQPHTKQTKHDHDKSREPSVMYISDSSDEEEEDDDQAPSHSVVEISSSSDSDEDSRTKKVDRETKRDFWASKSGASL